MPVDPEAGAMSSKLTCQCITPLCNAMILKILRCVDWWLTHSCLLDVELLANKMPTKVCVSAQLWMRPHVIHHTSWERKRDIWFVWKEIAFWNLWCILWAFHCSCSKSWWSTLPNDWYDFLLRLVRFFLRTQAMLTTEFCNDWYDFLVCKPKTCYFPNFATIVPFLFANPIVGFAKKKEQSLQNSKNGSIEKIGTSRWHRNFGFVCIVRERMIVSWCLQLQI